MPLFSSSSDVQINGGNFIDIGGDMTVHAQPGEAGLNALAELALFGSTDESNHQYLGPDRSVRHTGAARSLPYGTSRGFISS
jgi:hypothetical protein